MAGVKGVILAGGSGTRMGLLARAAGKQLLPVYDRPLVCYPLALLAAAGCADVLVISSPRDLPGLHRLLGGGGDFGAKITYAEQARPEGVAQALTIAAPFLAGGPCCLALGDNLFLGEDMAPLLARSLAAVAASGGAHAFAARVSDPRRFGVVRYGPGGEPEAVVEKPAVPPSHWAVTGLYAYGPDAPAVAAGLAPSARGELEITDVNNAYLRAGRLAVHRLPRGTTWMDVGDPDALLRASALVKRHRGAG